MEAWDTAGLQPDPEPNFIDSAFKEDPRGVTFRQWQPIETMLDSAGRHLESEDANNYGGSSQGSQTAMESPHRHMLFRGIAQCLKSKWFSMAYGLRPDLPKYTAFA